MQVIVGALASSGLHPTRLEIEITETVLLQNKETTLAVLHQLRALGVRIAMDDFGTGYSSLTYLQMFSVRQDQDRPIVRKGHHGKHRLAQYRAGGRGARQRNGHDGHRRRRRNQGTARQDYVRRLHRDAGLPVQPVRSPRRRSSGCSCQGARRRRLPAASSRPDRKPALSPDNGSVRHGRTAANGCIIGKAGTTRCGNRSSVSHAGHHGPVVNLPDLGRPRRSEDRQVPAPREPARDPRSCNFPAREA